ncbi:MULTISPECIES: hypothetical protein [Blautia]|uniref:hypothetical protein n=1 Tax=Blautia TaxID=572511 RepID=UPI00210B7D9D|nr:hypothetical protein [Blautia marasmi]
MHFTRAFPQHWRNPVFIYMILHIRKTKRNPYRTELYSDLASYQKIKTLAKQAG